MSESSNHMTKMRMQCLWSTSGGETTTMSASSSKLLHICIEVIVALATQFPVLVRPRHHDREFLSEIATSPYSGLSRTYMFERLSPLLDVRDFCSKDVVS